MNRRIGIVLILMGIGTLVASGYLFPVTVHKMNLGPDLLPQDSTSTNYWPYIASVLCLAGLVFLLNSHGPDHGHEHSTGYHSLH